MAIAEHKGLTLFLGCSLEFLSIITASANWGAMFDLEIRS